MSELTTVRVYKRDLTLLHKLKGELGCENLEDLIHRFIQGYYACMLVEDLQKAEEKESEQK